jgi:aspartyl-tRNA(Asn)/glutamyl-tRNA(Gln) amidotransferase subunit C
MTPDDINRLAALAGLSLNEDEMDELVDEVDDIVEYVDRLKKADTSSVEPVSHPVPDEAFDAEGRRDEVSDGLDRDDLMENAPATRDGAFDVPDVRDDSE